MKSKLKKVILLFLAGTTMFAGSVFASDSKAGGTEKSEQLSKSEYIAFYVENPVYRVNGEEKQIDVKNQKVAPYLKNGRIYIPVRFITEAVGGNIDWDAKKNTAVIKAKDGTVFTLAVNSDAINITNKNKENHINMGVKSELIEGRLYAPADSLAEVLGKKFFYEQGLIIISDKYLPDGVKDKAEIDALIAEFTGISTVGTQEKLVELLGYDPTKEAEVVENEGIRYDGMPIPIMAAPTTAADVVAGSVESAPAPTLAAAPAPVMESAADMATPAAGVADYSATNIQVQGVDEADIVKTDGQYIYYVRNQVIEIVKANSDGSFEYMSSFKLSDDNSLNFSDIFIDVGRIITIGTSYRKAVYGMNNIYTKAVVINTEDKKAPEFERSVEVKGNYITSRKIGNSVYFAAKQSFWYGYRWEWGDIMPVYRDTAISEKTAEIGYDKLRCFPVIINKNDITSLVGFNIDRPNEGAFIETFLGGGDNVYMSEKAMYIAAVNYGSNGNETIVNKFAADDGKLVFVKSGTAPGTILNQFSMDEYQSHFRIATNVYDYKKNKEYNGLYVFDNTMQIVGRIDDIAPGEHIYSTRFMGSRAFMVTFRTVDPLFAIDLSNPENPAVMGALKIPGYSNYLHPYDENHLIGFGKDTVTDSYGGAYYTGMKISLFDVTDITNPIEMFVETIGVRGTDSALLNNHKALLFSKDKNLLAFPVTVYEYKSNEKAADISEGKIPSYGTFAFSGAYVYNIDLKNGFNLRGKISHMSEQDMLKSSDWGGNSDLYIQRLLTIKDKLYAISNKKLTSYDLITIKPINELTFKNR